MINSDELNSLISNATTLADTEMIKKCMDKLALELVKEYQGKNPICLVVMNGGLVFAGQLLPHLNFLLQVEYCHLTRYGQGEIGGTLQWKVTPPTSIKDRHVLILDDIYDEGHTLAATVEACTQLGASSVGVAVLVNKKHDRKIPISASPMHCGFEVPDKFIFGYGLDYKGYFRNCNCLFALKEY